MAKERQICSVQRNARGEYVNVTMIDEETDKAAVDIRTYYTDDDGEIKPTKKGVRFPAECAQDIIMAIAEALEADEREDVANFLLGEGETDD